jgi:hypothetical protein
VILAAGVLVLLGLGLFVAGVLTGATALYWACVAVCVFAAGLIVLARRRLPGTAPGKTAGSAKEPAGGPATVAEGPGGKAVETAPAVELGDPPAEDVEVTDLLLVVDLKDEVLVVDEHPRYHLAGCVHLSGRTSIPMPLDEARTDGFTPCAECAPDRTLAERVRARRSARGG